jgi:hypothetical protein
MPLSYCDRAVTQTAGAVALSPRRSTTGVASNDEHCRRVNSLVQRSAAHLLPVCVCLLSVCCVCACSARSRGGWRLRGVVCWVGGVTGRAAGGQERCLWRGWAHNTSNQGSTYPYFSLKTDLLVTTSRFFHTSTGPAPDLQNRFLHRLTHALHFSCCPVGPVTSSGTSLGKKHTRGCRPARSSSIGILQTQQHHQASWEPASRTTRGPPAHLLVLLILAARQQQMARQELPATHQHPRCVCGT